MTNVSNPFKRQKDRKQKICSLVAALVFLCSVISILPTASAASGFEPVNAWEEGMFSDVSPDDWFYDSVKTVYEYGLMNGTGNGSFRPEWGITYAEACALSCRLHSLSHGGDGTFPASEPWYEVYRTYGLEHEIINENISQQFPWAAWRNRTAKMFYNATPPSDLPVINQIGDTDICGTPNVGTETGPAVYALYRAGVLTGQNEYGDFDQYATITRAEVAAIVSRIVKPELRQHFELVPHNFTMADLPQRGGFLSGSNWIEEIAFDGNNVRYGRLETAPDGSFRIEYKEGTAQIDGNILRLSWDMVSNSSEDGMQRGYDSIPYFLWWVQDHFTPLETPLGLIERAWQYLEDGTVPPDLQPIPYTSNQPKPPVWTHPVIPDGHSSVPDN